MTASVTMSHTAAAIAAPLCASPVSVLISECGTFGVRYWPIQPACAYVRDYLGNRRRKQNGISPASATSRVHRTTPTSFTSSRSFSDPRRLDALRRCPCQGNAAIPSYTASTLRQALHLVLPSPAAAFLFNDILQSFEHPLAGYS